MLSVLYIKKKKKKEKWKRLYLEERKIPIAKMREETVTATETESKQMIGR